MAPTAGQETVGWSIHHQGVILTPDFFGLSRAQARATVGGE